MPAVPPPGRFAPSPTGALHLGNLRTALLSRLYAEVRSARWLLRIDDLDTGRVRPEHERGQLEDLAALGLTWDGDPVRQSAREDLYREAVAELERAGLVYPCWCTRREIREAASAPHGELPEGSYPGTCRQLTAAERARREASGRPPALRVAAGAARVSFRDGLHGTQSGVVDDFVVRRNDGAHAYNLATVVDDLALGVGEVVRGEDLLETTARQLWLAAQLSSAERAAAIAFVHVPLVLGPSGQRLAKRDGAVTLADRLARGQTPAQVLALLAASVGLCEPGERLTVEELAARLDPATFAPPPSCALPGL